MTRRVPDEWDWERNADLRARLAPGKRLWTDDMASLVVIRVEEDGIVVEHCLRLVETSIPERQHLVGKVVRTERRMTWAEMNEAGIFFPLTQRSLFDE